MVVYHYHNLSTPFISYWPYLVAFQGVLIGLYVISDNSNKSNAKLEFSLAISFYIVERCISTIDISTIVRKFN